METHGLIDTDRARDQAKARWYNDAMRKARELPSNAAELDSLFEQIEERKAVQRQLIEEADWEKRTLDYYEQARFDDQQEVVERLRREIDAILRRAIPPINW